MPAIPIRTLIYPPKFHPQRSPPSSQFLAKGAESEDHRRELDTLGNYDEPHYARRYFCQGDPETAMGVPPGSLQV